MLRAGGIVAAALLALTGCQRADPLSDITGLLRAQGFDFLDTPDVTITPICSVHVGPIRYDFFWYVWQQRPEDAPGATHAARRLIQIRDGQTYDGYYGVMMPEDRPTCRPDSHELVFSSDAFGQTLGLPPQHTVLVTAGGLPQRIWVNGANYTRAR